jgi:hypothetical protein
MLLGLSEKNPSRVFPEEVKNGSDDKKCFALAQFIRRVTL